MGRTQNTRLRIHQPFSRTFFVFFSPRFVNLNATQLLNIVSYTTIYNQSVENAGVAFVKGADVRSKFFEENKRSVMYDEQVWANKAKD